MSVGKDDLTTGTPAGPSNVQHRPRTSPPAELGATKRRRCEYEDSASRPVPSTKRRLLGNSTPFLPVEASPSTSQIAVAEQLLSPEVTNSSAGHQHPSEFYSNPDLSQDPPTKLCGVANPVSEEPSRSREGETQDWRIRGWVLAIEGSEENDPQPPPIEPVPDPQPEALGGMPPAKRKPSQESLRAASSYGEDVESIPSTDARSNFYSGSMFTTVLEQNGIHMHDSASGLDEEELDFCQELLSTSAPHPQGSMLDEAVFLSFSELTHNKSEQWLMKNMHSHLFPQPELLALRGDDKFRDLGLIEGCDDAWTQVVFPSYGKRPQPDSTIAFKWESFSREEVRNLGIIMGLSSKYLARENMLFPFITREAKCDRQSLDLADRQNLYSMSVALEGIVDLFRRVDRLEELNGKVLGLSISYNNNYVTMYAHHVVTSAQKLNDQSRQQLPNTSTAKYRTRIGEVNMRLHGGKDRWMPYDFFYNACLKFSKPHLARIREAIADLDDPAKASSQSGACVDEEGQDLQAEEGVFKKPRNGGINAELRKRLAGLEKQLEASNKCASNLQDQLAKLLEASDRRESALRDQLAELRDDAKSRESALRDQLAKEREDAKSRESALRDQLAKEREDAKSRQSAFQERLDRVLDLLGQQGK